MDKEIFEKAMILNKRMELTKELIRKIEQGDNYWINSFTYHEFTENLKEKIINLVYEELDEIEKEIREL